MMASPSRSSQTRRFGEFELDLSTRELWSNGERQTLAPQQFQLLELLIRHPGELVTRELLVRHLWPAGTFVDYDQGIKKAVKRLREALNDSAEQPRFIETLPRQGYRFIADVDPQTSESIGLTLVPSSASGSESGAIAPRRQRSWLYLLPIAALLFAAVLVLRPVSLPRVISSSPVTNDGIKKYSPVTDGSRIYFVERLAGKFTILETSIRGGIPAKFPFDLPRIHLFDVSPTGTDLLFGGAGDKKLFALWIEALPGGSPHRVGEVLTSGASFSPDGSHIIFTRDNDIFLIKPDGTDQQKILSLPSMTLSAPRISPDGKRLRFTAFNPATGIADIWEATARGEHPHLLWKDWQTFVGKCCGTWSANGKYFYFQTYNGFVPRDIWVAPGTESELGVHTTPAAVTSGPLYYSDPTPTRDNQTLLVNGSQLRAELVRREGNAFVPFLSGISASDVEISRDGQWVTFVDYPEMTLWRSRTDGSDRMQLTFSAQAFLPRWSPDGSSIIFTQIQPGKRCAIFIVSRDGGTPRELIPEDRANQIDATWSPDGLSIVFGRTHLETDLAIYSFNLKTRGLIRIPGSEGLTSPRLSPDGKHLIALTKDWATLKLYEFADSSWSDLATAGTGIGYPNWSRDSNSVYARVRRADREIVRIDLKDRQIKTLFSTGDLDEPDPLWMGLDNKDSILLRRERSTREIYAVRLQPQ